MMKFSDLFDMALLNLLIDLVDATTQLPAYIM